MRTNIKSSLALPFGLLLLLACGGGGGASGGITLSAPSAEVVEGFNLAVEAASPDPKNTLLVWTSSDLGIATVDSNGLVLGCTVGTVVIAARAPATGERGTIELRVVPDAEFSTQLPVDMANLAPSVERTSTIERCEVTIGLTGIAARVAKGYCRRYHQLRLPGAGRRGRTGEPELPDYTLQFAIPVDPTTKERATWTVTVERESPLTYPDIRPWPLQPLHWMTGETQGGVEPFVVDEAAYAMQTEQPDQTWWAEAVELGNLPVLRVRVTPLRYLASSRVLEVFETTRVVVTFEGAGPLEMPRPLGDYKGIQERRADEHLAETLCNHELLTPITHIELKHSLPPHDVIGFMDLPFDMLILTRKALEAPARRLARWRQDDGTRVWLAVLDETLYPDADAIFDAVATLYESNIVAIESGGHAYVTQALLIFGDVEHIPTFEGLREGDADVPTEAHPQNVLVTGTDVPYSSPHDGLPPGLFVHGRISVEDAAQGEAVVDKIVAYESRSAGEAPNRAAVYGHFQDGAAPLGSVSGTVTFTSGSRVVEGVATTFRTQLVIGDLIRPNTGTDIEEGDWPVRVANIVDDLTLQLEQPWPSADARTEDGLQVAREDRREDVPLLTPAERVWAFWKTHGVSAGWGYTRTLGAAPTPTPQWDYEGSVLRLDLRTSSWAPDASTIATRWAEGLSGVVLYSGPGDPTQWLEGTFPATLVTPYGPGAGPWYPIVFAMNGYGGYFDSESDRVWVWNKATRAADLVLNTPAAGHWPQHDVCFCEHVLRVPGGGAVAAIGASRGTNARINDQLIDLCIDDMYDDYPVHPIYRLDHSPMERLGYVYGSSIYRVWEWLFCVERDPDVWDYVAQTFHLFGDPMLRIRPPRQAVDD